MRILAFVTLFIASASLIITTLGFGLLDLPNVETTYVVLLLLPVTLAALLLGAPAGAGMGFLAGMLMYAHASVMPLNVYEMAFVTPATSFVMLTVLGLILGIAFAIALRGNPPAPRRFIYIGLVCILGSVLFSAGFTVHVFASLVVDLVSASISAGVESEQAIEATMTSEAVTTTLRLGNLGNQVLIDALLMMGSCIVTDVVLHKLASARRSMGVQVVFNLWLTFAVAVVFMVSSAFTFVAATMNEGADAAKSMETTAAYLIAQQKSDEARNDALSTFLDRVGVDPNDVDFDTYQYYADAISTLGMLDGYTVEDDGVVFISSGQFVLASDVPGLNFDSGGKGVRADIVETIDRAQREGKMQRIVYDGSIVEGENDDLSPASFYEHSELAYLYSVLDPQGFSITIIKPASMVFADRVYAMGSALVSLVCLLLAVVAMVSFLLNRLVARRVDETNKVLRLITEGNLEARVVVDDPAEFKSLSAGINATVDAMQDLIAEAETRMDEELATAKRIQESALPSIFPPYPDILKFDIYASMNAAKEVGGDFYDFFLLGDAGLETGKLGFVVADVSGKGIPAALFMMEAKTQLRNYVTSGMELGEAVENANRQLCEGNAAGMFVTAWVGVLDYATGHVDYVNAGHNPPLLWSFGSGEDEGAALGTSGSWQWLRQRSGLPLGMFDTAQYRAYSLDCVVGDQFLLYSDGVTEAMDVDGKLYGEDRLLALAERHFDQHPRSLVEAVRFGVAEHARGAEQSDDITILALEVGVPPELTATISVPADTTELEVVNTFIHTELDRRLCPLRVQNKLDIAVEELFVNVCRYAYPDAPDGEPGIVRVSYTYGSEPPSVTVALADDGVPFNPLEKPDAETPGDVMDIPIGGLGILMAKRSVDDISYERIGNSNIISIVKRW